LEKARQLLTQESMSDRQHNESAKRTSVMPAIALYLLVICAHGLRRPVEACTLRIRRVTAVARLALVAWGLIPLNLLFVYLLFRQEKMADSLLKIAESSRNSG
jgi:hypothetical protein